MTMTTVAQAKHFIACRYGRDCVPALRRAAAQIPFQRECSTNQKFMWCVKNAPLEFGAGDYPSPIGFSPLTEVEEKMWQELLAERYRQPEDVMEWYPLYRQGKLIGFENKASRLNFRGDYAIQWLPGRTKGFLWVAESWLCVIDARPGDDQF